MSLRDALRLTFIFSVFLLIQGKIRGWHFEVIFNSNDLSYLCSFQVVLPQMCYSDICKFTEICNDVLLEAYSLHNT